MLYVVLCAVLNAELRAEQCAVLFAALCVVQYAELCAW